MNCGAIFTFRHSREGGNPENANVCALFLLDSRLRGNDGTGDITDETSNPSLRGTSPRVTWQSHSRQETNTTVIARNELVPPKRPREAGSPSDAAISHN
jgi:hypothetical protein